MTIVIGEKNSSGPNPPPEKGFRWFARALTALSTALILSACSLGWVSQHAQAFSTETKGAEILEPGLPPTCAWLPENIPTRIVLCIHGLGLHMGSYKEFGEALRLRGIGVYALDIRGFG